jgi:hypothetical protein
MLVFFLILSILEGRWGKRGKRGARRMLGVLSTYIRMYALDLILVRFGAFAS